MDGNFCSVVFLPILFLSEKKTKKRKRIWNGHNEQEGGDEAEIDTENHGKRERGEKEKKTKRISAFDLRIDRMHTIVGLAFLR